jgi:hypothetical protein
VHHESLNASDFAYRRLSGREPSRHWLISQVGKDEGAGNRFCLLRRTAIRRDEMASWRAVVGTLERSDAMRKLSVWLATAALAVNGIALIGCDRANDRASSGSGNSSTGGGTGGTGGATPSGTSGGSGAGTVGGTGGAGASGTGTSGTVSGPTTAPSGATGSGAGSSGGGATGTGGTGTTPGGSTGGVGGGTGGTK